jgi:Sec-independent protein translocase protein TatA
MTLGFLNIGPFELLIMAAAAVMLFGGDLPQTARKVARMVGRLRGMAADLGREFTDEMPKAPNLDMDLDLKRLARLENSRYTPQPLPEASKETDPDEGDPAGAEKGQGATAEPNHPEPTDETQHPEVEADDGPIPDADQEQDPKAL